MKRTEEAEPAEWEVLPPEKKAGDPELEPLFRWLSVFMDNLIRIPGTQFRIGLDPILGLIPGIGDTGSALISAVALIQGARAGLPKIVLARMSMNVLINQVVGTVPVFGDVFSAWFKSNERNYHLLQKHGGKRHQSTSGDWAFVVGTVVALALITLAGLYLTVWLFRAAMQALG